MEGVSTQQFIAEEFGGKVETLDEMLKLWKSNSHLLQAGDSIPTLDDLLKDSKKAPTNTKIAVVPKQPNDSDLSSLRNIRLLEAYISASTSAILYKNNPKGWDIGNPAEAADFITKSADTQFRVITQGLPSVLNFGPAVSQSFNKQVTTADLHFEFLNGLFADFNFSKDILSELDGVLNKVRDSLEALKLSWSDQTQTLNHLVSFHYPVKVMNTELNDWKLRLFYLQVNQHSWRVSVGKSSIGKVDFKMNYFDYVSNFNDGQFERNQDTIQNYIDSLTKQGFEAIEKLTTPVAVKTDETLNQGGAPNLRLAVKSDPRSFTDEEKAEIIGDDIVNLVSNLGDLDITSPEQVYTDVKRIMDKLAEDVSERAKEVVEKK
ncbi:hypothetical protein AB833_08020 [Chromatiales bacterium (ex Bugula neritina AB1)]|nr:hypothetical protein AB833_08020 [Chromatiales bacterium (ex Bugula neritina AB1)]